MMTGVQLQQLTGPGDTHDMYSGFGREDVAPALDTADLEYDSGFQVDTSILHPSIVRHVSDV